jgi:hypothetical protein
VSIWDTWATDPRYSRVVSDPRFLQSTPAYKSKVHDILERYGFTGTAEQNELAGPVTPNAYSVAARLKQNRAISDHSSFNAANAAGLEESGAAAAAGNAINEDYKRNVSDAGSQMQGELSGALGDYTDTINSIFGDVELNPVVTPITATTPSIGGTAGNPAPGGREIDRPGTQVNPWHVPTATGGPLTVVQKLKPKVLVKGNHGVML